MVSIRDVKQLERALRVAVEGGTVAGIELRGLRMWRGVPYAAPPVGRLRLRAPQPVIPWHGVRDASEFGPISAQDVRGPSALPTIPAEQSEDCLTLNVIAPATDAERPRPVMVYVHGGAYSVGSSREMPEQGEGLVHDGGVVFVNLNYRLGALGWLDLSRYSSVARPIESNLGLRDCVAALRWVRANIAAFGGDPGNVTVFGESAGANAVTTLMAVPEARGLFARAIAESAPAEAVYEARTVRRWAEDFVGVLREVIEARHPGITAARDPVAVLDHASTAAWVRATARLGRLFRDRAPGVAPLSPVIDGDFLPERPTTAMARGTAARVPLIIGTNDREGSLFRGRLDILASTPQRIAAIMVLTDPMDAAGVLAEYPGLPRQRDAMDLAGDHAFWFPSVLVAGYHSRWAPVHMYRFDIAPRLAKVVGLDATHGIELFAVFDRIHSGYGRMMGSLGGYRAFERVGRRVRTNWLRFAFRGEVDPGWPRYDEDRRLTLVIDERDRVESDPRGSRRRAWERFVPHM